MTQVTPKGNLRIFPVHEYGTAQITIEVHDRRPDLAGQWDAVDEHLIDLGPPSEPAELVMFTYAAISSWVLYEGHGVVGVRVAGRDRAWNEEEGSHPDPDEEYLLQI